MHVATHHPPALVHSAPGRDIEKVLLAAIVVLGVVAIGAIAVLMFAL